MRTSAFSTSFLFWNQSAINSPLPPSLPPSPASPVDAEREDPAVRCSVRVIRERKGYYPLLCFKAHALHRLLSRAMRSREFSHWLRRSSPRDATCCQILLLCVRRWLLFKLWLVEMLQLEETVAKPTLSKHGERCAGAVSCRLTPRASGQNRSHLRALRMKLVKATTAAYASASVSQSGAEPLFWLSPVTLTCLSFFLSFADCLLGWGNSGCPIDP